MVATSPSSTTTPRNERQPCQQHPSRQVVCVNIERMSGSERKVSFRDAEMSLLRASLERARSGRGQLAIVSGEPGIGKTALATALADHAVDLGARVTWGRAWEFSEAPPYYPLLPCLHALGIDLGANPDHRLEPPFATWQRVLSALARAAQSAPIVWIVEDLHAADLLTWDLMAFLSPALQIVPAMVVVTLRHEDSRIDARTRQRLSRMQRDALSLALGPLGAEDIRSLAMIYAGRAISRVEVARLADRTGGNPFFLIECVRALRHSALLDDEGATLPPTVRQMVAERVGALPEPARRALTLAAIVGREFSAAMLARMSGALPARIIDDLRAALREGLVTESAPGLFAFAHAIVRDAIEDATPAEEGSRLHAAAYAALGPASDSPEVLVERARHALLGMQPENEAQAIALADHAADVCEKNGAFDRAHVIYQRLERARRSTLASRVAPPAELLRAARVAMEAGRHEDALRVCDEVARRARALGDSGLLAQATLIRGFDLRPAVVDAKLVAWIKEALEAIGSAQPLLRCKLLARLAAATQPAPDPEAPMDLAREAIALARSLDDEDTLREVLCVGGSALVGFAPMEERLRGANELLSSSLAAGDGPNALRALGRLAMDHAEGGDFAAFDSSVDRMLDLASAVDHPRHRFRPLLFASMRALALGRIGESERHLVEIDALADLTDDPALSLSLEAHRVGRARLMHRDDELRTELARLEEGVGAAGVAEGDLVRSVLRAGICARLEDPASTATELARIEPRTAYLARMPFFLGPLAEAYAFAGTNEQRLRARSLALSQPSSEVVGGHVPIIYEGPWMRYVALLDGALGDHRAAENRLRAAMARSLERGHRAWIAQLQYDLGQVLRRAGRVDEGNAAFGEAAYLAAQLGMVGLAKRAGGHAPATGREVVSEAERPPRVRMIRESSLWRIEHGDQVCRVRDSRGMQLLARLIDHPGEELHVLALASDEGELSETNAGAHLDASARRAYRERLGSLTTELAEARLHHDLGRLEKLEREREMLEQELSRAVGLGGRARLARSASERARINIQRRVKDAVARVSEVDAVLGRYLAQAVRTGTYCSFRP
jgi:tetratricopeptide (TPR) repeat protein